MKRQFNHIVLHLLLVVLVFGGGAFADTAAERTLKQARADFEDGALWKCTNALIQFLANHRDPEGRDAMYTQLGDALVELHLYDSAEGVYKHVVERYVNSRQLPRALLGLQRLEYQRGNLDRSLEYYDVLMRGNPGRRVQNTSAYFAGMANFKLNHFGRALETLQTVDASSIFYPYARYSLAVSLMRMQRLQHGLEILLELVDNSPKTADERHVHNQALLTLGYSFFEMEQFDKAHSYFDQIEQNSDAWADARLGAGWAAMRQENWQQAVLAMQPLETLDHRLVNVQEAMFLLGRCYMNLENYDNAIAVYDSLITVLPEVEGDPMVIENENQRLEVERKQIANRRKELLLLEHRAKTMLNFQADAAKSDEQKNLLEKRTAMLAQISQERRELDRLEADLERLTAGTAIRQQRRNWRAYAEYGKIRAEFLKRQNTDSLHVE